MSVFSEIMPSVSPENVEEAEKIKEEANNCFRSMQIVIYSSNIVHGLQWKLSVLLSGAGVRLVTYNRVLFH